MNGHEKFPVDEREWKAQERALREVRDGLSTREAMLDGDHGLAARYRHVAHALRVPPAPGLPATFAIDVARQAASRHAAPEASFERGLLRTLVLVMALSSAVVVGLYGVEWWRTSARLLGTDALGWTIAVAACAALSWSLEWVRRRGTSDGPTPSL